MKTFFYSVLMMCALFTSQNANAQEAKEILNEPFTTSLGEFTVEGDEIFYIMSDELRVKAANHNATGGKTSYLVSPVLNAGTQTTVKFESSVTYSWTGIAEKSGLYVRKEGATEFVKLEGVKYSADTFQGGFELTEITLPEEYDNSKVQVALGYTPASETDQDTWHIINFVVTSVVADTPVDPTPDPEPTPSEGKVLYNVVFDSQANVDTWTVEGGFVGKVDFVMFNSKKFVTLNHYLPNIDTSYFVSPKITLASNNTVSFDNTQFCFPNDDASTGVALVVRTADGAAWEKLDGVNFGTDYSEFVNSGEIAVPEKYNGKEVQFAFECKFAQSDSGAGYLYVKNFTVKGESVDTGIENVENTVADNKYYDLQGRVVENPAKGLYIHNGKKIIIK